MADVIAQFFGLVGVDLVPPATFSELIPYLLVAFLGIGIVAGVFSMFRYIATWVSTGRARF